MKYHNHFKIKFTNILILIQIKLWLHPQTKPIKGVINLAQSPSFTK